MAYTTIKKPSDYFNTKLYSGTGSSQSITGVEFQPDLIWFKCRQANNHNWFDVIRGSNKIIQSSTSNVEATSTALLTSFDSDGFTVNTDDGVNGSGKTYASWNWLANGAGSANTDGTISSTVSANTTSGFSIVSYTGTGSLATVGHGLGAVPKMIIVKERSEVRDWIMYHQSLGATKYLLLNTTDAEAVSNNFMNDTEPTSSVFTVKGFSEVNKVSQTYIAYCFAEKQGYSKFGSYTGNGSTDGTFVYTGFKPAWVMIKANLAGEEWGIWDSTRNTFNIMSQRLQANNSAAENTFNGLDFTSNGFKLRSANSAVNRSGDTLIYMAFAEEPLVGDNPATAR